MYPDLHALLSGEQFDCFAHFDPTTLTTKERMSVATAMNHVLFDFLKTINHTFESGTIDRKLRHDVRSWAEKNLAHTGDYHSKFFNGHIEAGTLVGELVYPSRSYSHETRFQMAIGSLAYYSIDDESTETQNIRSFQFDVWQQNEASSAWCTIYRDFIRGLTDHFGALDPRIGSLGATGWANSIDSATIEQTLANRQHPHLHSKNKDGSQNECCPPAFATSIRVHSGLPEPYAVATFKPSRGVEVPLEYWVTSMDHLKEFINYGNDLFSWPKEVMVAETFNFMTLHTLAMRQANKATTFKTQDSSDDGLWTCRDTLCEVMTIVYDSISALDKAFITFAEICEEPYAPEWKVDLASKLWQEFRMSVLNFYIQCPRYKLGGLRDMIESEGKQKDNAGF